MFFILFLLLCVNLEDIMLLSECLLMINFLFGVLLIILVVWFLLNIVKLRGILMMYVL